MSGYLARLKALTREKHIPQLPSKTSKAPFEPFEGSHGERFPEIAPAGVFDSETSKIGSGGCPTIREMHRCACGEVGIIATGWYLHSPEKARWYCGECYRTEGRA